MVAVLEGFLTIWLVIGVGWLMAQSGVLDEAAQQVMGRLSFFVGSPALMFAMLSTTDLRRVFSGTLGVSVAAVLVTLALWLVGARAVLRLDAGATVIGAFGSCYVNASNLGLPIATYVLRDASWMAPILLVQVGLLQPVGLSVLDALAARDRGGRVSWAGYASMPFRNPMTIGTLLGVAVNLLHLHIPSLLMDPVELLAGLAVPTMLVAFGVSLRLGPLPGRGEETPAAVTATVLKLVVMPLLAWLLGVAFGVHGAQLFAVVVVAGLPTAQNSFVHAVRYGRAVVQARDVVFWTTVLSVPSITLIGLLLG